MRLGEAGDTRRLHGAALARHLAAVAEEDHGGDGLHAVARAEPLRRLRIDLGERTLGSSRSAAFSNSGAIIRHGPHQGAQKSTSTGTPLFSICLWKRAGSSSAIGRPGRAATCTCRKRPFLLGQARGGDAVHRVAVRADDVERRT